MYKLYKILGQPVLAVPDTPRGFSLLAWRFYHTSTPKRRAIQRIMQMAVLLRLDSIFCTTTSSPLKNIDPDSFERWFEEVRSELGKPALQPVIIWPPQRERGRVYVNFIGADGRQAAFVKLSFDAFNDKRLKKESRVLRLLEEKALQYCRVPKVLADGTQKGHEYLVLEPLPLKAHHISHTMRDYPGAFVEEMTANVRVAEMDEIELFGWWQRFGEMAKGDEAFNSFGDELKELIISCSGLPVCPVHGDLGPANIVTSKEDLWVFDWEESSPNGPVLTDRIGFDLGVNANNTRSDPEPMMRSFGKRYLRGASPEKRRDVMAALAFRVTFEKIITGEYIRGWKRMDN